MEQFTAKSRHVVSISWAQRQAVNYSDGGTMCDVKQGAELDWTSITSILTWAGLQVLAGLNFNADLSWIACHLSWTWLHGWARLQGWAKLRWIAIWAKWLGVHGFAYAFARRGKATHGRGKARHGHWQCIFHKHKRPRSQHFMLRILGLRLLKRFC